MSFCPSCSSFWVSFLSLSSQPQLSVSFLLFGLELFLVSPSLSLLWTRTLGYHRKWVNWMEMAPNIEMQERTENRGNRGREGSKTNTTAKIMFQHQLNETCCHCCWIWNAGWHNAAMDAGCICWSLVITVFATNILFCSCTFSLYFHILNGGFVDLVCQI